MVSSAAPDSSVFYHKKNPGIQNFRVYCLFSFRSCQNVHAPSWLHIVKSLMPSNLYCMNGPLSISFRPQYKPFAFYSKDDRRFILTSKLHHVVLSVQIISMPSHFENQFFKRFGSILAMYHLNQEMSLNRKNSSHGWILAKLDLV